MSQVENELLRLTAPYSRLVAANPHATDPLANGPCRGIYVTVAGNLTCRFVGDTADVTVAVEKGHHPFRLSHVRATSTATLFVGD